MSDAIVYATASELLSLYRARALSPVELTRAVLAQIEPSP
jgi:Asp-tRNA(Asn)/Glu-tRNA(Gln) amidotransferase A subunit family amidase